MEYDTLTFYRSFLSRQWRWRFQSKGNGAKLANGGESYTYQWMAVKSAFRVCNIPNEFVALIEIEYVDTLVLRNDSSEVMVRFE